MARQAIAGADNPPMTEPPRFVPPRRSSACRRTEALLRSAEFLSRIATRRTVRDFSDRAGAGGARRERRPRRASAPSGANRQPWRFVVVSDPAVKRRIRIAAEAEEKESYERRMPEEWLEALAPLGTDWHKPFLETAPYLIVVFKMDFEPVPPSGGSRRRNVGQAEELLRVRVRRDRLRIPPRGAPPLGPRDPHAHAVADGLPERDPRNGRRTRSRTC